jgi:hypothetical protein
MDLTSSQALQKTPMPTPLQRTSRPRVCFAPLNYAMAIGMQANIMPDMEIDHDPKKTSSKPSKGRIDKKVRHKSSRKASIVFPKYKNGKKVGKSKGKK